MSDGGQTEFNTNTSVFFAVNFHTVEQVKKAFEVLAEKGRVIEPLVSTPYSACMGSVVDPFGIRWRVMVD